MMHPRNVFSNARLVTGLVFAFLFFGLPILTRAATNPDTLSTGIYAQVENLLAQQQQLKLEDSLAKTPFEDQLRLVQGDSVMMLEIILDSLRSKYSVEEAALEQKMQAIKNTTIAMAVAPFSDTLFFLSVNLHSVSAKDRVANLQKWMQQMYRDQRFTEESLTISENGKAFDILYNNKVAVLSVSAVDAWWVGKKPDALAMELRDKINEGVVSQKTLNESKDRVERIGWVLLIVFCLGVIIFLLHKAAKYIFHFLQQHRSAFFPGIKFGKFVLFTPKEHEEVAGKLINFCRLVAGLVAVYFSLPLLFGLFPITEKWAGTLFGWVFTPAKAALHACINFVPDLFTILVIYFIFKYALIVTRFFAKQVEEGDVEIEGFHADWAQPTFDIFRVLMYAFMLILVFPYLPGSSSPAFQGVSVFLGVLLSLGSSNAIANLIAGLVITYMRPFKAGDRVTIGEITGEVKEKTLLVTRIKTANNEEVTVPNSTVLSSNTTNYTANTKPQDTGLIINTKITMRYEVPWTQVHEILIAAALKTPLVLAEPVPFVRHLALDLYFVSYQVNVYTKEANKQGLIRSTLNQNIQDGFKAAGIEMVAPQYAVNLDKIVMQE